MTLNKKGLFLNKIFLFFTVIMAAFGCAVQQKPQGGPKDVTPPRLLKATPLNMTHNFSSKVVRLDFDEYFKLQYQEITVTPVQDKTPDFKISKKSLIINFKDSLLKNTTYVINFGKAIADLNEGNVLKNFTYVFSTGTHIDSLSISGNVMNVQTQEREKDVTVMLFTLKQDSLYFGKKRPSVSTITDTAGNFTISNLHEGIYKLYALKEAAPNKIYDNENELIAFPSKIINLQNDTAGVQLRLFKQVPAKFRLISPKFDADGKISLIFNKPLEKPSVHIILPKALDESKYVQISKTKDTALVYMKNMDFDSLKIAVYENNKPIDTVTLRKGRRETFTKNIYIQTTADVGNLLKPGTDLGINIGMPIVSFDPTLITLTEDSTVLNNYTLQQDTGNLKHFTIKYKWKPRSNYTLVINENALTGIFGDKNKKVTKKFQLNKPENYGQLTLNVTVPDTGRAYIVELYNEQNSLLHTDEIRKNTSLVYRNYMAGKYKIKVIYDDNKNGKWDAGSIKANRQPENIWVDRVIIALRGDWESKSDLLIPREPAP